MIDTLRNKLSHAFAYFADSLGTGSLADTDRFPSEDRYIGKGLSRRVVYKNYAHPENGAQLDEPMTTLWEWEDEQRKLKGTEITHDKQRDRSTPIPGVTTRAFPRKLKGPKE